MSTGSLSNPNLERLPAACGDLIAAKYRLQEIVGASGMGVVFSAQHVEIEKTVAVKFLVPRPGADDALPRFRREAKVMAKIHSENVVRVMDFGTHVSPQGEAPFIVMEFLEGDDLARVLKRRGPMPLQLALEYILQACRGLADSHAVGVIHRDLKPSNLFLARGPDGNESIKIIDFGVAKYRGTETSPQLAQSLTHTQVLVGSPRYMSPEQIKASRDVDARSDVWSLALILHELLTGKPAYKAASVSELFVVILTTEVVPVTSLRPDVPPALGQVLARALAKDPEHRTSSVTELAKDLLPFAEPSTRAAWEKVFANIPPPPPPRSFSMTEASGAFPQVDSVSDHRVSGPQTASAWAPHRPKPEPRSPLPLLGGLALLAIGVGAATAFVFFPPKPAALPPPSPPALTASAPPLVSTAVREGPREEEAVPLAALPISSSASAASKKVVIKPAAKAAPSATATATATAVATEPKPNLFDDPK